VLVVQPIKAMWPGLPDPSRDGAVVAVGIPQDRALVIAAVGSGARWGELTALLVSDVELVPTARVRIEKAWKSNGVGEYARQGADKKYLGAPKTLKGRRRVRVGQTVADVLADAVSGRAAEEYVFVGKPDVRSSGRLSDSSASARRRG
jgi:integrase